jgi:hypothetical protein
MSLNIMVLNRNSPIGDKEFPVVMRLLDVIANPMYDSDFDQVMPTRKNPFVSSTSEGVHAVPWCLNI